VYPVAADDTPPYERIAWWKFIFSCLGIKKQDHLQLRWMCRTAFVDVVSTSKIQP
jgi:hypothetical protein